MGAKILITGSKGQLGSEIRLLENQYPHYSFLFTDIDELDITNSQAVESFFAAESPSFIINCAAYTAVDKAEEDTENCFKVNELAVGVLARSAAKHQCKLIHVSTDYVFDGTSCIPYTESMPVNPQTTYGRSKLAGEQLLLTHLPNAVVVRTSWLYSSFGHNFVKTILRLSRSKSSLKVIFDQIGTPTYAADLAQVLLTIVSAPTFTPGVFHYSNEGVCSWYDFAVKIAALDNNDCSIIPIETKDYPTQTPRPHYSVFNKQKIKNTYPISIAHWEHSLKKCLALITDS